MFGRRGLWGGKVKGMVLSMGEKTRKLTLSALFSAFAVVLLFIASVLPTGQLGIVAAASLFVAAAVVEAGIGAGAGVFIVSSALGMLLIPNRSAPLLFILFFGYYPALKSVIERVKGTALQWALKLLVFNLALTVIWFFMLEILFAPIDSMPAPLLVYLGGNAIFALYDYGFTKAVWFYIYRVSKHRRKQGIES